MRSPMSLTWIKNRFIIESLPLYTAVEILKRGRDMIFYDFEVFAHDWLMVGIDPSEAQEYVIVNDVDKIRDLYQRYKDDIWVGFNSRHYDVFILKGLLLGMNPKEINDYIILEGNNGWTFSKAFMQIKINNYDVMNGIDRGLKYFEGSMGHSIKESSIPFNVTRKLTDAEIEETIGYCRHDVEQTIEVFLQRKADFDAQMGLLKLFKLPLSEISRTKVQLAAKILDAHSYQFNDEFDISIPDTLCIFKYQEVVDWYLYQSNRDYRKSLDIDIAGVPHSFGWGGVHGAREKYVSEGYFINMDVASLYPSLMIRYDLISRACNGTKFKDIVDLRLKYKAEKNPMQAPLKIVINGTYGAMKDKYNPLYDPRQANNVCVYGQLLLLDLIEHLESAGAEIIQSNTDGVLVRMPDGDTPDNFFQTIDDIAYEWEDRTGLTLELDEYVKVIQKDVNNYIIIDADGGYKSKGAYVKRLTDLDYDLAIVNKAVVDYLIKGTSIEDTVMSCQNLKDFQLVKKISNLYKRLCYGDLPLAERCVRCFASVDANDAGLFKLHNKLKTVAKVENTPAHCRLVNGDINGKKVPKWLDRGWYIDLAKKRAKEFGIDPNN